MTIKELNCIVFNAEIYKKVENLHFLYDKRYSDYATNEKYKTLVKEIIALVQLEKCKK